MPIWRTLFELSSMSNNQEMVLHTAERIPSMRELEIDPDGSDRLEMYRDYADAIHKLTGVRLHVDVWSCPRRLFSRQVLPAELTAGLDTNFRGQTQWHDDESEDEKAPELTRIIDALTKMLDRVSGLASFMTPEHALVEFLAYDFYDCMSGGSSTWALAMVRELVDKYKIDLTLDVYPAPEDHLEKTGRAWYNLADFLEEIKSIPRLDIPKYFPAGLPALPSKATTS